MGWTCVVTRRWRRFHFFHPLLDSLHSEARKRHRLLPLLLYLRYWHYSLYPQDDYYSVLIRLLHHQSSSTEDPISPNTSTAKACHPHPDVLLLMGFWLVEKVAADFFRQWKTDWSMGFVRHAPPLPRHQHHQLPHWWV